MMKLTAVLLLLALFAAASGQYYGMGGYGMYGRPYGYGYGMGYGRPYGMMGYGGYRPFGYRGGFYG